MSIVPHFEEVKRTACKASIMIEGLTGKGKSGLALIIARGLADNWNEVFDIDTENNSIKLFAGIPCSTGSKFEKFKVGALTPDLGYKPTNYIAFREAAKKAGAKVVIKDSISHAWSYKGGILDMLADLKKANVRYQKDSYAAWGDEAIVKEKNELLQLLRDPDVHVITTVRVKEKMEYSVDDKGKTVLVSLGEQQIQQADLKYEPDLVLHMIKPGKVKQDVIQHPVAKVIKSRYAIFDEGEEYEFTPQLIAQLKAYLEEGVDPETLLESQRQDYITAARDYLDAHPNAVSIWQILKKDIGHENTKLEDLPLDIIKQLYIGITE